MKTLTPAPKFLIYAVFKAVRHPKQPIAYYYCARCRVRFHPDEKACPKCGDKVGESPDPKQESPVPWYCSVMVIIIGIISWVLGAGLEIAGLDEVGRALVYIPLGSLFGMSLQR